MQHSALCTLPLVSAVGLAVDFSMALNARTHMQSAIDAAAFAALSLPDTATYEQRQALLQASYAANGGLGTVQLDGDLLNSTAGAAIKVKSAYAMPTVIMGIVGRPRVQITAEAGVSKPIRLKSANFRLDGVTGAWDKEVLVMGRPTSADPYAPLLKMTYTATNIAGFGTTVLSSRDPKNKNKWIDFERIGCTALRTCTRTALSGDGTSDIDLSAMQDVYLQMDISAKVGKVFWWFKQPVVTLKSNDPLTSDQVFVDGKQMETGLSVNMVEAVGCNDSWVEQRWEDGGGHQGVSAWDGTDFRYMVKGGCTTTGGQVRLTR